MNVSTHTDDDLLFLSPDLLHDVQGGRCVRTVFMSADISDESLARMALHESGVKAAYAQMAGVANAWTTSDAGIAGHPAPLLTLVGNPSISVVFLRLPNANTDGSGYSQTNFETLQGLWEGTIPQIHAVDGTSAYTKASLTATLTALMSAFQPDIIRTQDYLGDFADGDHPDHHAAARFTRAAHGSYTSPHVLIGYLGYASSGLPQNVFGADLTAKQQAFYAYGAIAPYVCDSAASCQGTAYADWLQRQYTVGSESGGGGTSPTVAGFAPSSGPVGTPVTISGTNLSGATAVTFHGTAATFTVNSPTQITATVPSAATTGTITVTTPGGTAQSAAAFTVNYGPGSMAWLYLLLGD